MNKKTLEELNEELLSKISSGSLGQYRMNILDLMVPYYRSCYPEIGLDDFIINVIRKSYPEYHLEASSEEDIAEVREYIAHYCE